MTLTRFTPAHSGLSLSPLLWHRRVGLQVSINLPDFSAVEIVVEIVFVKLLVHWYTVLRFRYDDFTDRRSQTNECDQSERAQGSQSKQSRRSEGGDSRQSQRSGRSELMQSHRSERNESRQTEATGNGSLGRQNISPSKMAGETSREIALLPRDLDAPMSRVAISPPKGTSQYNRCKSNFAQPKLMSSH